MRRIPSVIPPYSQIKLGPARRPPCSAGSYKSRLCTICIHPPANLNHHAKKAGFATPKPMTPPGRADDDPLRVCGSICLVAQPPPALSFLRSFLRVARQSLTVPNALLRRRPQSQSTVWRLPLLGSLFWDIAWESFSSQLDVWISGVSFKVHVRGRGGTSRTTSL